MSPAGCEWYVGGDYACGQRCGGPVDQNSDWRFLCAFHRAAEKRGEYATGRAPEQMHTDLHQILDPAKGWPKRTTPAPTPEPKPDPTLLPSAALLKVTDLMSKAAVKHPINEAGEAVWQKMSVGQHLAAALRHVYKHLAGEKIDPEFGFPHLVHFAARALMAVAVLRD